MKRIKRISSLLLVVAVLCTLTVPTMAGNMFYNTGTFNNHASFTNNGAFDNVGTVNNYGNISNPGIFRGNGTFKALSGSKFNTLGSGTFSQGRIETESNATITGEIGGAVSSAYLEAVDVVKAIGIMADMENGFGPTLTMTRSQGAMLVASMILGSRTSSNLQGTGTKFDDVPADHWAAGYIEYLASVGIVHAENGNSFNPDGILTTAMFVQMLLCALGYDAEIEGLTRTDWQINTVSLAARIGLFNGDLSASATVAVTREKAALYIFNTLQAPLVEYPSDSTAAAYVVSTNSEMQTISDVLIASGNYVVEFAEKNYPALTRSLSESGSTIWVTWNYRGTRIGSYAYSSSGAGIVTHLESYADHNSIMYAEAVAVVSAIGVMSGINGSFYPNNTMTRAQGAQAVAYMILGTTSADILQGSGMKFSDVPAAHWAAGYIEYLASRNIAFADTDGQFRPDAEMTGADLARMLLCALGYDAEIEGLTGNSWETSTVTLATQVGLADGIIIPDDSTNINREEAALYIFNALCSPLIKYDTQGATASGRSYVTTTMNASQTISTATVSTTGAYVVEFAEAFYSDLVCTEDISPFGEPGTLWKYCGEWISLFTLSPDLYYSVPVTLDKVYLDLGLTVSASARYYINGGQQPDLTIAAGETAEIGGYGVSTLVWNHNDIITISERDTYLGRITEVDTSASTAVVFDIKTNVSRSYYYGYSGTTFSVNDYVIFNRSVTQSQVSHAALANNTVTGVMTAYVSDSSVTVNGTKYFYNRNVVQTANGLTPGVMVELILDWSGYVIDVSNLEISGSCGDNLTWALVNNTLSISGTGAMNDYTYVSDTQTSTAPWYGHAKQIKTVGIESGVTSIGDLAFRNSAITSVTIPSSVERIGDSAFFSCTSLETVEILSGVKTIGSNAFFRCDVLPSISIPASVTSIGADAFRNCALLKTVNYAGTKAEWSALAALNDIGLPETVAIICSDGTYSE